MNSVLVGLFDTQPAAVQARQKLLSAGFAEGAVTLVGGAPMAGTPASAAPPTDTPPEGAIARFFDSLFGGPDDRSDPTRTGYTETYQEAFKRGAFGVSVTTAGEAEMDTAERVLNEAGAVDLEERAADWRKSGWTGGVPAAQALAGAAALPAGETQKLQEVEEQLQIGKRAVARGGVRVFTRMTEVPVSETVVLREEHANVKRTAVDRPATEADFTAFKEGSVEVREMTEEAVVSKTARVTGEVEIGKTTTEREETVRDTVRKTQVDVEQIGGGTPGAAAVPSKAAAVPAGTAAPRGPVATGAAGSPNRDPITGEPGAHPVGTGVGAAAGGVVAGALAGSVVGPVGTVVGAAAGAVAGGLAGKGVAEAADPTVVPPNPKPKGKA